LVDGRVEGTWKHTLAREKLSVAIEPFQKLPAKVRPEIRARAGELAATLGRAEVEVKFV
jgi:hypothetical protein